VRQINFFVYPPAQMKIKHSPFSPWTDIYPYHTYHPFAARHNPSSIPYLIPHTIAV